MWFEKYVIKTSKFKLFLICIVKRGASSFVGYSGSDILWYISNAISRSIRRPFFHHFFVAENREKPQFQFCTMSRGCLSSGHSASPRRTGVSHAPLRRSWRSCRTWQSHLMNIWFTLLFEMFENVQKSVLKPKEAISCFILVLVEKLKCAIPNKTRDSSLSNSGLKNPSFRCFYHVLFKSHLTTLGHPVTSSCNLKIGIDMYKV
jgi:hypothetical protein